VRCVGSGHPAIRATHHKTLEITSDEDISQRATCVIAVRATGPDSAVAGDVRVTVRAGEHQFTLTARGNSSWGPGGPLVIRRSPVRLAGTFATHATAAANDLPRELVGALQDPHAEISLDIEPLPGRLCAVLFAADPTDRGDDPRLRAEVAAADQVIAEDAAAAALVGEPVANEPRPVTGRTLVVATHDLPGRTVIADLSSVDVETVGLAPALAAAAAFPARGPLVLTPENPAAALRDARRGTRVVVEVAVDQVMAVLRRAGQEAGVEQAVLVQGSAPPVRVATDVPVELWGGEPVQICFGAGGDGGLDPRVRAAVDALVEEQVPTRAAARVLAELTGWPRRTAYEYLLGRAKP
jgi:hypothetical protein